MTRHLRYGIIGCGSMGREHIENIQAMPRADGGASITAIADPHAPSRDAALAICRSEPRSFDEPRELLTSGLCDAVVIATPNFTHAEVLREALATDLPILVEKPLVTRIEDGVELVAREAERRRRDTAGIVWVAHEYRYMPPVAEAIRMAHEGAAGRV
ncbi:MAG: Gfo/Idh/MocA family oxidoreductase, partial [Burkholderiales bacterium]|nr:Gfo/Idh/MocA family oxidoreductase [Burkholderiales bacterium]